MTEMEITRPNLRDILTESYLREIRLAPQQLREDFIKVTRLIENTGIWFFFTTDRFDDIVGENIASGCNIRPFLSILLSASVRVETLCTVYRVQYAEYMNLFLMSQTSHQEQLSTHGAKTHVSSLPETLAEYSKITYPTKVGKGHAEFAAANKWLVLYYLFIATGSFGIIIDEIQNQQRS